MHRLLNKLIPPREMHVLCNKNNKHATLHYLVLHHVTIIPWPSFSISTHESNSTILLYKVYIYMYIYNSLYYVI